jgi:hypothetical protein
LKKELAMEKMDMPILKHIPSFRILTGKLNPISPLQKLSVSWKAEKQRLRNSNVNYY